LGKTLIARYQEENMYLSKLNLPVMMMSIMLLNACAWVEQTDAGKKVTLATAQQVTACKELGKTAVSVKHTVAGMARKPHIIKEDLEKLAKNSAAEMGGNTIIPASEIVEGKQTFRVFKCPGN
jgi:hypothetical protein